MTATITNITTTDRDIKVFVNFDSLERVLTFGLESTKDEITDKIKQILGDFKAMDDRAIELKKDLINLEVNI